MKGGRSHINPGHGVLDESLNPLPDRDTRPPCAARALPPPGADPAAQLLGLQPHRPALVIGKAAASTGHQLTSPAGSKP